MLNVDFKVINEIIFTRHNIMEFGVFDRFEHVIFRLPQLNRYF